MACPFGSAHSATSDSSVAEARGKELVYGSPEWFADPLPYYVELREKGVLELSDQGVPTFLVGRHQDVLATLANTGVFSSKPPPNARYSDPRLVPAIADNDPPDHTRYRKAVYKFFSPGALKSYRPVFAGISNELIDSFSPKTEADFVSQFANRLPLIVLTDLLGFPREMMPQFSHWVEQFHLHNAAGDFKKNGNQTGELRQGHSDMHDYLLEEIERRRREPQDDIVGALVNDTQIDGRPLENAELLNIARLLLVAGVHTTSRLLAFSMWILTERPAQLAAINRDRGLIPRMLDECLRLESPLTRPAYRWTTQDTEVCGVKIPKGSRVMVMLGSANHDPSIFTEAELFDLTRPNLKDHVSFGVGTHFCLGAPLARLEAETAYNIILDRLTNLRKSENQGPIDWDTDSTFFRGPRSYLVEFDEVASGNAMYA